MSVLLNEVEVFRLIYQSTIDAGAVSGEDGYIILIEVHLEKYRRAHTFMKEVTVEDYCTFLLTHRAENRRLRRLELEKPIPTARQFWKAAYNIGSLGNSVLNIDIDLHECRFCFRELDIIPLGKLRGSAKTLRRFICLGWVLRKGSANWWYHTGHVLVMDIDPWK